MGLMADGDESDPTASVTFLYKLTEGAVPRSYGMNVAKVAGLPDTLVQRAAAKSAELEARQRRVLGRALCSQIYKVADAESYKRLFQQIQLNEFC